MTVTVQVGGHVSSAGGIFTAVERSSLIEAEAVQIFPSAPQQWRKTNHKPEAIEKFRQLRDESMIGDVWLHNIYLANLAAEKPEHLEKSIDSVINALTVADALHAQGVVLHTGSHGGRGIEAVLSQVTDAILRILDESPGEAILALENSAGQGGVIGSTFGELGVIIRAVDSSRLQVCVDTCHAFAAGYDISEEKSITDVIREFDSEIGLDRLAVIHANDSKMELGGNRDRHENIGDGHIGFDGFRTMMAQLAFQDLAWLLEVPGIEGKGPDLENVNRLKRIRHDLGIQ